MLRHEIEGIRSLVSDNVEKSNGHDAILKKRSLAKHIMSILGSQSPLVESGIKQALERRLGMQISDSTLGAALGDMRKCEPPMIKNKRGGKDRGYRLAT